MRLCRTWSLVIIKAFALLWACESSASLSWNSFFLFLDLRLKVTGAFAIRAPTGFLCLRSSGCQSKYHVLNHLYTVFYSVIFNVLFILFVSLPVTVTLSFTYIWPFNLHFFFHLIFVSFEKCYSITIYNSLYTMHDAQ